ncbi:MAG: NAD-dependent epimerase/dehydratase family protein [Planctomycetes bacterium]|nr:NAD-dependent epimerase/dehydratase family protein [Planctomycetota bacterium]
MPHPSRRTFLASSLGAAAAAGPLAALGSAASRAPATAPGPGRRAAEPLRLLILGGTGFLGPVIVQRAVDRGHAITLFNRGRTNADLFPELEKLRGDRNTGDLAALHGREFDAIIDTSAYVPGHVTAIAELFADRVKHYTLVSSISAYDLDKDDDKLLEEGASPLATVPDDVVNDVATIQESFREGGRYYGGFKALCEQAAESALPGRVANVRPGLIVGPRDSSDRFTWWPVRIDRGGEVLCPGDPTLPVQVIDVRDLGEWIVHLVEQNVTGVYNAVGFDGELSMGELLAGCKCATSTPVTLTWVDEAFLLEQRVGPWMELPLWLPESSRKMSANRRAIAAGLTFRPVADTIRDTLQWAKDEATRRQLFRRTGLAPDKEQAILAAWKSR